MFNKIDFNSRKYLMAIMFFSSIIINAQETRYDSIPKYTFATVSEFWNQLDDIFNDPNFSNAHWGVVVQSLVTGEYFYKKNENKLFMPASNLKLFTSASGLLMLGPNFKFKTEIYKRGNIDGSILKGDLILKGFGDPTISGRFYNDNILKILNDWADTLSDFGIDEIEGNIIGDDNAFDDRGLGSGWAWDYESYWFSAPSGAISFNDNCVDIIVKPSSIGSKAEINILPNTKYVIIVNNVNTVPNDSSTFIDVYRERGTSVITISGTIRAENEPVKTFSSINNPTQFSVVVFKDVLEQKGIKVKGYALDIDDIDEAIDYSNCYLLFTNYSQPLSDIVRVINKNSQNFFAEQLLKTIGYNSFGLGTAENGIKASEKIFTNMGINTENLNLVDGSGLSRLNMVTPNNIVALLNYMYRSDVFTYFYNSLPIAGVDGTLANRLRKTRAQSNVRAKTGFIGSVRSLSGYVYTGDQELLAFAILANNFTVPIALAENIQDLVCQRLANFKRK